MIPFLGYAPDLDPTIPGVMTNCSAIVPSAKGFKGAPTPVSVGLPALEAACFGAALMRKTDDTTRLFAGTSTKLFEAGTSSWTDRSGTVTGLGTADQWRFAQFGDVSLAVAKTEILQALTTGSAFANATSTAPKGSIVETVNNFVFLFDVNDQGALFDSADRPDAWWCAAKGGHTSWAPSVTTEAATNNLRSTSGKITAGRRFGYQIIAYKLKSMYIGTYVGSGPIWDFQLLPGEAGALSQESVVSVGTPDDPKHIFMGFDNFYLFSGGRAVPIGNVTPQGFMSPVKDTVFAELNTQYYYACKSLHDAKNSVVYFFYPVSSAVTPDKCVVYNYRTNRWGRDDRTIEQVVEYISAGITYDALGATYSTYDDFPNLSYDLAFASAQGSPLPAVFDTTHTVKTLTGVTANSSITTGDYGDPDRFTDLVRVTPQFLTAPTSASLVNFYKDNLSDSLTTDQTTSLSRGRFDFLRSSRWHRGRFDLVGNHEISGFTPRSTEDGEE
jgi:hypothetical protein